jgi:hypothetical protein
LGGETEEEENGDAMTEAEWLTGTDANAMLAAVQLLATDRQRRLLNCSTCRRQWHVLTDARCRTAVEVAERYADGLASDTELTEARKGAYAAYHDAGPTAADEVWRKLAFYCCLVFGPDCELTPLVTTHFTGIRAARTQLIGGELFATAACAGEEADQCHLIRDIFGNPFRPVTFDPRWLTSDVMGIARGIYEDRAFDRMPILADALMDAGCEDDQVLGHCRSDGPHVRGCWVVDAVLGRR